MATSIRIQVGLQAYLIEFSHGSGGEALPTNEARALLRRVHDGHSRPLQAFARSLRRSTLEWDDDQHVIDDLLRTGRLRVRPLVFKAPGERIEAPEPEYERVDNEIAETHTVEIELIDDDGNPVAGEPYQIKLPDGTVRTGTLDARGKARIAGIEQAGVCQVCFYERDAAAWGLA